MHRISGPFRVYVGLVPTGYLSKSAIDQVIEAGLQFCGTRAKLDTLRGEIQIVAKPSVLMADRKLARHAYTHPEVAHSALSEVFAMAPRARAKVLGRALNGFPGASVMRRADGETEAYKSQGYYELENAFPGRVEIIAEDDAEIARYRLSKGPLRQAGTNSDLCARSANEMLAPLEYVEADFTIYIPKLKTNPTSNGFSGAIRLGAPCYRGAFASQHACDALEICNPDLVISDGIIASSGGNEISQRGHELGVILIANNALAHDWVAAQIFNLDPMSIEHLKAAAERGWGPQAAGQIELGGAGYEGVRQLAQKTELWDLGATGLNAFAKKFEEENQGSHFPLEIISAPKSCAGDGSQAALLDWLHLVSDFPKRRLNMKNWPKCTVYVGQSESYPTHALVYALGDSATQAINRLTSTTRLALKFSDKYELRISQLKNGRRHIIIIVRALKGSSVRLRQLSLAFNLGSLGRMTSSLVTTRVLLDRLIYEARKWWKGPVTHHAHAEVIMTTRMRQNSWWALKPIVPPAKETSDLGASSP